MITYYLPRADPGTVEEIAVAQFNGREWGRGRYSP